MLPIVFKRLFGGFGWLMLGLCGPALADATLEYSGRADSQAYRVLVKGDKVRLEQDARGAMYSIFRAEQQRMLNVNRKRRQYIAIDAVSTQAMAERMQTMRSQMLDKLPPQQRAQMAEQLQAGQSAPQMATRPTEQRQQINGIACRVYEVLRDGQVVGQLCLAQADDLAGLSPAEYDSLMALNAFNRRMAKMAQPQTDFGMQGLEMAGIPVRVVGPDGKPVMELKRVSRQELSADLFTVPQGYRQFDPLQAGPSGRQ